MKEIDITALGGVTIGQAEDAAAGTGCTLILCENGMPAGLDVRGGAPASRESEVLKPLAMMERIQGILLSGGSAFGLDAAGGVMQALEERGIGYEVGPTHVPVVCESCLFDLTVGNCHVRPDKAMGYRAAQAALAGGNYRDGNYGAGCGATVGKWRGMDGCMKSGIGSYAVQTGDLQVGAIVAVNALGDVYDPETGRRLAGLRTEDGAGFADTLSLMLENTECVENKFTGNTTIGVILTNALFGKAQLCKLAGMAHDGYARAIRPVHTSADGDSIYAASVGTLRADQDIVGALAAEVMSRAIVRAVTGCESAYGYPAAKDFCPAGGQA